MDRKRAKSLGFIITIFFIITFINFNYFSFDINKFDTEKEYSPNFDNNYNLEQKENSLKHLNIISNSYRQFCSISLINTRKFHNSIFNYEPLLKSRELITIEALTSHFFNEKCKFEKKTENEINSNQKNVIIYDIFNHKESIIPNSNSSQRRNLFRSKKTSAFTGFASILNLNMKSVFSPDDRSRITPTTSYPWCSITKLYIIAADDTIWEGTGAMIDENHVLTVGHVVYMHNHGGWVKSIEVIPGFDNGFDPYGYTWATYFQTYAGWTDYQNFQYDIAVLTLEHDIGTYTGWMGLQTAASSDPIYTGILNTAGYPGDLDSGLNMYHDSDYGRTADEYTHWVYMDTYSGQSGSPIWIYDGSNRYILSVLAYGDDGSGSNLGTRLNYDKYNDILNWLDGAPSITPMVILMLLLLISSGMEASSSFNPILLFLIIGGILGFISLGVYLLSIENKKRHDSIQPRFNKTAIFYKPVKEIKKPNLISDLRTKIQELKKEYYVLCEKLKTYKQLKETNSISNPIFSVITSQLEKQMNNILIQTKNLTNFCESLQKHFYSHFQ